MIIGLCGRSGSGKSTACKMFSALGFEIIDTDRIAREVTEKGCQCLTELVETFGGEILFPDGSLNRKALFSRAMKDEASQKMLNDITHKHILNRVDELIAACPEKYCIVDAPLLFESGYDAKCDQTIAIISSDESSIARIRARDGLSDEDAMLRLSRQHDNQFLKEHCDVVINNDGTEEDLRQAVRFAVHCLLG